MIRLGFLLLLWFEERCRGFIRAATVMMMIMAWPADRVVSEWVGWLAGYLVDDDRGEIISLCISSYPKV